MFSTKNIFYMRNIYFMSINDLAKELKRLGSNSSFQHALFGVIFLFVFCVVFFMNIKTFMSGDDYVYSFLYQTHSRLSSFSDIVESQYKHYYIWGGRSVVHAIAQVLLFTDDAIWMDVINSIAFVGFILAMYFHITAKRVINTSLLFIIFALTWILQPAFAETSLWITGSANYLWGTLIILLFLLPYRLYRNRAVSMGKQIIYFVTMLLGGVVAGWTNENTAAAMLIMIVFFILYYRYLHYSIPLWMYSGLLGATIGYIIMIAAPGNFARAEGTSISAFLILYRTMTYTQSFVNYLGVLNLGAVILMIIYLSFKTSKPLHVLPHLIIFFVGLFVSIYVMVASPGFPPRAWFGCITFNIIIFGILLFNLDYQQLICRRVRNSILVFCVVFFGFSFYDAFRDVTTIDAVWKERIQIINTAKASGEASVSFDPYSPKTKFGLGDTPYALKYMSDYYGVKIELNN